LDPSLVSKCIYFCLPQIDYKEIDSAQILYGLFIKNEKIDGKKILTRNIWQSIATRLSFLPKFIKEKPKNFFSGDLRPNGRTLGFIGNKFNKFLEENSLSENFKSKT
jgi:hypothetical protein